jgi:putative N-acetyltransferase (TIGR04045 family)
LWWGSRLAVHAAFRHHGRIGATLIRLAVTSAHAQGCRTFLAHVQSQNVPMFERLNWQALKAETLLGRPHHLMQADLSKYPPCDAPFNGFVTRSTGARA